MPSGVAIMFLFPKTMTATHFVGPSYGKR
jgi:hypothetical protein